MMKPETLSSFHRRIDRVLALVSSHLDKPLPLERLASEAALSPFHFHRIWRATTGEPIGETLRRLRIERAAHSLTNTSTSITQIAMEASFASSQAFSRAFRQATGFTPSEYRALKDQTDQKDYSTRAESPSGIHSPALVVEITTLEPFQVVAKRKLGPYKESRLAEAFRVPWTWSIEQGLQTRLRGIYGIPYDDPFSVSPSRLRYDAGLDLGPDLQPPPGLQLRTLGGGEFAKVRVIGSYDGLENAYQYLFGTWLPASGREAADRPLFNHFHGDPDETPEPERITDVYLPIKPEGDSAC